MTVSERPPEAAAIEELLGQMRSPEERVREAFTPDRAVGVEGGKGNRVAYMDGTAADTGLHCYWRKPLDGEICIAGFGDHEFKSATMRGMAPLQQYGLFPLTPRKWDGWEPNKDPFRQILLAGGIGEFTAEQVLAHRWHVKPHPVLAQTIDQAERQLGVDRQTALLRVMPQLEGANLEVFTCGMGGCRGRTFLNEEELASHEIVHQDDVRTRALKDGIAAAIAAASQGSNELLAPLLQAMTAILERQEAGQQQMAEVLARLAERRAPEPAAGKSSKGKEAAE